MFRYFLLTLCSCACICFAKNESPNILIIAGEKDDIYKIGLSHNNNFYKKGYPVI